MADAERKLSNGETRIDFQTDPSRYRHWKLSTDGDVATLLMDVDEKGALFEGYELKLAADHIMLVDDGSSAVSLPELPLLAVLPGTGGLTRVTDKRKVRRDHADFFCTTEEGIKGKRAVDWRLVDEVVPSSKLEETIGRRVQEFAARSGRPPGGQGIKLDPLKRARSGEGIAYGSVSVELARAERLAIVTLR